MSTSKMAFLKNGCAYFRSFRGDNTELIREVIGTALSNNYHSINLRDIQTQTFYKELFRYLLKSERPLQSLDMLISEEDWRQSKFVMELFDKVLQQSKSCNQLNKLILRCKAGNYDCESIMECLAQCRHLQQSLDTLILNNFFIFIRGSPQRNLGIFLQTAAFYNLKILDLRKMRFEAKHSSELAEVLANLVTPKSVMKHTKTHRRLSSVQLNKSPKKKRQKSSSSLPPSDDNNDQKTAPDDDTTNASNNIPAVKHRKCQIEEFYIGGHDAWNRAGIQSISQFFRHNHNLEILGINLRDSTFLSTADNSGLSCFVLSLCNHPALKRLEFHDIKPKLLDAVADIWDRRVKHIRFSELYVRHIPEESAFGPRDHLVLPALNKMIAKIPWLTLLELKLSMYSSHIDVTQLCLILSMSPHLNGCIFDLRTSLSSQQLHHVTNKFLRCLRTISTKDATNKRTQLQNALIDCISNLNRYDNKSDISKSKSKSKKRRSKVSSRITVPIEIPALILSFADISLAHNAGMLYLVSPLIDLAPFKKRKEMNDFLLSNWNKLPNNGDNISDPRYRTARQRLIAADKKMKATENEAKDEE